MELLDLFMRMDFAAAWTAILETQSATPYLEEILAIAPPFYPRYCIVCEDTTLDARLFKQTMARLLFATDQHEYSREYHAARQKLLSYWELRHEIAFERGSDDRIAIKIDLDIVQFRTNYTADKILVEVATLAALVERSTSVDLQPVWGWGQRLTRSPVFNIASVDGTINSRLVTDEMLLSTQAIPETWEMPVSAIRLLGSAKYAQYFLSTRTTVVFFRTMLLHLPQEKMATDVELSGQVQIGVFQAACSALMVNRSVRRLCLSLANDYLRPRDQRLLWSWVAYAMFSADATSTINDIDIILDGFSDLDLESFKSVLDSNDPAAGITVDPAGGYRAASIERAAAEPTVVAIRPRTTLLLTHNQLEGIKTDHHVETLRVVEDVPTHSHVAVIYPGAGVCWVARDRIIADEGLLPVSSSPGPRQLKHITLEFDSNTFLSVVIGLLQCIGAQIESLDIVTTSPQLLDDVFFNTLFAACSNLRRLGLINVAVSDFRWICPGAPGEHLESLSLRHVTSTVDVSTCHETLLVGLSCRNSRLRELSIQHETDIIESLSDKVIAMLDCHHRLERCFLYAPLRETFSPALVQAMRAHNGVPLHIQKTPLPLKCMLAMFSVLSTIATGSKNNEEHREEKPRLGSDLLAVIFRFAAPPKHRVAGCMYG